MMQENDNPDEALAARIKRLRIASGLTQRQLGERIGISQAAVGKWETGVYLPKGRFLAKLAEALGIKAAGLLGETNMDDMADEVRLIAAFRMLTKEHQAIAVKLLEALKQ